MSAPSPRGRAFRVFSSMTISRAPCSSGTARRSASIPPCWASPDTIATSRAPSRSPAATRRAASSAPSATSGIPSSRPASFVDLDDLNAQAETWCIGPAADRRCPDEPQRTVRAVFAEEAGRLLALPDNPAPLLERLAVSVGKTPYVRFDLNDYSIPHTHVRRVLSVLADPHEVRIVDGAEVLACHRRSYDKGAQIEDAAHIQALVEQKRAARQHRATDRLAHVAPASQTLLVRAAERGANLGAITAALIRLLDRANAADLQAAILEALERDVPHPNAVRLALERLREQRGQAPQVALALPAHVQLRDAPVQPHALESYDQLKERSDD